MMFRDRQVRNRPDTVDYAMTLVAGRPFAAAFHERLRELVARLTPLWADVGPFHAYPPEAFHSTVCPVVRTHFTAAEYETQREELQRRQLAELFESDVAPESVRGMSPAKVDGLRPRRDLAGVRAAVVATPRYVLDFSPGRIEVRSNGEVLLHGCAAADGVSRDALAGLRDRLGRLHLPSWDAGAKAHITLGTVELPHELAEPQRQSLNGACNAVLRDCPVGATTIDALRLVFYAHRSLRRIVWQQELPL